MESNQRIFIFSLAIVMCLAVSIVTSDEVDEAKAAALLAEMLYPEYANSPEFQAVQKRTPSASENSQKVGFQPEAGEKRAQCTGIPAIDLVIEGCFNSELALKRHGDCFSGIPAFDIRCMVAKRTPGGTGNIGLDLLARARQRQGKRAPSCTGIPGLDILGCGEAKRSLAVEKFKRGPCTGLPQFDVLGCGEAKR